MARPLTALRFTLTCAVAVVCAAAPPRAARAAPMAFHVAITARHFGEKSDPPVISRWETDEGEAFVLDLSTPKPLLKFEDSSEIWVLQPTPGPRGDTIYRNDLGEEVLRANRMGGMTVFTTTRPGGSAAALDGASPPLRIIALGPTALWRRFYQASVRATRAVAHQVVFDGVGAESATAALFADAASVAADALVDLSDNPANRGMLTRIVDVVVTPGGRPNASVAKGVLTITVTPALGVAGRPSSRRIERALGAR